MTVSNLSLNYLSKMNRAVSKRLVDPILGDILSKLNDDDEIADLK